MTSSDGWTVLWESPEEVAGDELAGDQLVDGDAALFAASTPARGVFSPVPVVTIGAFVADEATESTAGAGEDLAPGWAGDGLVVVDGLTITWGRDGVLDQPTPATGRLRLFDPTKTWATSQDRRGQLVTVRYSGVTPAGVQVDRVYFRGRIGSPVKVSRKTVAHPDTGELVEGSLVELPLVSILVDLANSTPTVAWPAETMGARMARVAAAAKAAGVATGGATIRAYWEPPQVAAVAAKDQVSLLQHLTDLYDSAGADRLNYLPHEDRLEPFPRRDFPSTRGMAGLTWDGSDVTRSRAGLGVYVRSYGLVPAGGSAAGYALGVDSASLEYDPADGIVSPARITRVAMAHPDSGAAWATRNIEQRVKSDEGVAADERRTGVRTARVESLVGWNNYAETALSDLEYMVRREGSQWLLEPLVLSTRKVGGFESANHAEALLAGREHLSLLFLQRSWLPQYGLRPVFGVMGGTIAFRNGGWELELTPAPITTTQLQHAVTWEQLDDGSAGYEVQWWDGDHPRGMHESLTYEDLAYVATGLNVTTIPVNEGFDS